MLFFFNLRRLWYVGLRSRIALASHYFSFYEWFFFFDFDEYLNLDFEFGLL
jgi:hypothetical protein